MAGTNGKVTGDWLLSSAFNGYYRKVLFGVERARHAQLLHFSNPTDRLSNPLLPGVGPVMSSPKEESLPPRPGRRRSGSG